ncbi:MAG: NFACT family protein, partial [Vibrio fluvialis]
MNVLLLKRWLQDNGPWLIGSRLDNVSQLDLRSLLLRFEGDAGTRLMVLSVREEFPVLAWIDDQDEVSASSDAESNFCKAVRFHLQGYRIVGIEQQGFDRSVVFTFKHKDVYGEETIKYLRHELAGRSANAFILSIKSMVVSLFRRIKKNPNRVRLIQTGKPLPPPPPLGKFIAAESTAEQLADEMAEIALDDGVEAKGALKHLFTVRVACCDKKTWPSVGALLPVEHDLQSLFDFIRSFQRGEFTQNIFGIGEDGRDANQVGLESWQAAGSNRTATSKAENVKLKRLGARMDGLVQQQA